MKVAIIGGGASGVACAICLKQQNKNVDVTIYEKMPRILKKVLATGNGRCNITNLYAQKDSYFGDSEFTAPAFEKYPPQKNIAFFNDMGLLLREEDEGRVYPVSGQASSVVNVLLSQAENLGVKILTDTEIKKIKVNNQGFILNDNIKADKVVISAGGSAAKQHGTDGGAFKLLEGLGLNVIKPTPALTGVIADKFPKSLKGVRNLCQISLLIDNEACSTEVGEVQFNDYGISGIPVMNFSHYVGKSNSKNIYAELDTLPEYDKKELVKFSLDIKRNYPNKTAEEYACGLLPKALGNHLLLICDIKKDTYLKNISEEKIKQFITVLKKWKIKITDIRGFDYAQVTAGGLDTKEMNADTLSTKKYKNLYVTGEAVNVYGDCGGYNLQWAWSSARLCADAILKEN